MKLNDTKLRNAMPHETSYKLADGRGLYILIKTNGSKLWRLDYRFGGRRKTLSMGSYPETTLKLAREKALAAKQQLAEGLDPSEVRRQKNLVVQNTFEVVAREWHEEHRQKWASSHGNRILGRLVNNAFPDIGQMPIHSITPLQVLRIGRRLKDAGKLETAHRVLNVCSQVFRYAVVTERAVSDPVASLRGALPPAKPTHHATIVEPKEIARLLDAIGTRAVPES